MNLTIEKLGLHGDGVANGPVFAPRTLPGEIVEGDVVGGRMATPRIVVPSVERVRPQCPHYKTCGGCSLQHASDAFVSDWKVNVVRNALKAHGIDTHFRQILTSPPLSRRRAALSARRTKKGASVGFHGVRSGIISEIKNCQVMHADLLSALPGVEALTKVGASRKAELTVILTRSEAGLDVSVTGGKPLNRQLETQLGELAGSFDFARLSWDGELIAMLRPPAQLFGCAAVIPPAGAFLQATKDGEKALQKAVAECVEGSQKIVDLFAGCGTLSLPLAEQSEIHAVEGDAGMLAALDLGWRQADGVKAVTTETRDLFRRPMLPDELDRFDAIVIDPPRAGAEAQTAEIARSQVKTIAMVSCNPITFSRDVHSLKDAGFSVAWVQTIDQFRWSSHVETVAHLTRK